ncbi:Protein TIC 55 [Hibiscus syriacus]|uniref:Protein TIC 55 n=1 Tax=Hibiscus syriacus TaxID=106335 RepID=A0A6A3A8S7_HIBSY|nr:Protein TIC 55 [Hibiscus syriacus]
MADLNACTKCVKVPQPLADGKIPRSACLKTYEVKESQGVVWVWMSQTTQPNPENYHGSRISPGRGFEIRHLSESFHMITPFSLRTSWILHKSLSLMIEPIGVRKGKMLSHFFSREIVDKDGEKHYLTGLFLCRPTGQGKSMLIVRFGGTQGSPLAKLFPEWYFNQNGNKVFEQDMGFLSSQNEWMDKVGHGMPYHFGHSNISPPTLPAVVEHAPVELVAGVSASSPAKGGIGTKHATNLANRYFRHVIHCKSCSRAMKTSTMGKIGLVYADSGNMCL